MNNQIALEMTKAINRVADAFEKKQQVEQRPVAVPVSVHLDSNGVPDGVLIQTLDISFVLKLKDEEGGKEMNWHEATRKYKLPSKEQWMLVLIYFDQVQKCLEEAGGEKLKLDYYWSSTEISGTGAWTVNFGGTYSYYPNKSYSTYVRAVAA